MIATGEKGYLQSHPAVNLVSCNNAGLIQDAHLYSGGTDVTEVTNHFFHLEIKAHSTRWSICLVLSYVAG